MVHELISSVNIGIMSKGGQYNYIAIHEIIIMWAYYRFVTIHEIIISVGDIIALSHVYR